jgi:hypothetical protein
MAARRRRPDREPAAPSAKRKGCQRQRLRHVCPAARTDFPQAPAGPRQVPAAQKNDLQKVSKGTEDGLKAALTDALALAQRAEVRSEGPFAAGTRT